MTSLPERTAKKTLVAPIVALHGNGCKQASYCWLLTYSVHVTIYFGTQRRDYFLFQCVKWKLPSICPFSVLAEHPVCSLSLFLLSKHIGIFTLLKMSIFWDITPCSPVIVYRRFGETSPQFSESKSKPSRKPAWSRQQAEQVEDWGDVSPKHRLTFTGLHFVMSQKQELFVPPLLKAFPTITLLQWRTGSKNVGCQETKGAHPQL
jgi:hypothetical protein